MVENWTTNIEPQKKWLNINFKELWSYKYLIGLFIKRDFTANYKQTILGPLWFVLQPLLTTVIFTIIFGNVAKLPTAGLPAFLFYFSGITCWNYFASCLTKTSDTFVANAYIFGKVYFPRLVVPISNVLTNMITFLIQFVLLIGLIVYYLAQGVPLHFGVHLLMLPILLIQMALLGLGCGIIVSAITTKYRDLQLLVGFAVQLWMYCTPVAYSLDIFSTKWHTLLYLNPMTGIITNFRSVLLGNEPFNWQAQLISIGVTIVILLLGSFLFSRVEGTFMDTV